MGLERLPQTLQINPGLASLMLKFSALTQNAPLGLRPGCKGRYQMLTAWALWLQGTSPGTNGCVGWVLEQALLRLL